MRSLYISVLTAILSGTFAVSAQEQFAPLIEEGKEWGYAEYKNHQFLTTDISHLNYYRLRFEGETEIEGTMYHNLYQYSKFSELPAEPEAYMREEDGKVYARFKRYSDYLGFDETDYFSILIYESEQEGISEEYLLYDFSMKVGDTLVLPHSWYGEHISMKCVETGVIETENGPRRFLKFENTGDSYGDGWRAFDYIVEGVGPVGNCTLLRPYRMETSTSIISSITDICLLYIRDVEKIEGKCLQGKMRYKSPEFEVFGLYDPSVWFWATSTGEPFKVTVPDRTIQYNWHRAFDFVAEEEIEDVLVFDILGRQIAEYHPNAFRFNSRTTWSDRSVVVRVSTANGTRSFRLSRYS